MEAERSSERLTPDPTFSESVKPLLQDEDHIEIPSFTKRMHEKRKRVVMLARGGSAADRSGQYFYHGDVRVLVDGLIRLKYVWIAMVGGCDERVE